MHRGPAQLCPWFRAEFLEEPSECGHGLSCVQTPPTIPQPFLCGAALYLLFVCPVKSLTSLSPRLWF